jgi:hypothetical protein
MLRQSEYAGGAFAGACGLLFAGIYWTLKSGKAGTVRGFEVAFAGLLAGWVLFFIINFFCEIVYGAFVEDYLSAGPTYIVVSLFYWRVFAAKRRLLVSNDAVTVTKESTR